MQTFKPSDAHMRANMCKFAKVGLQHCTPTKSIVHVLKVVYCWLHSQFQTQLRECAIIQLDVCKQKLWMRKARVHVRKPGFAHMQQMKACTHMRHEVANNWVHVCSCQCAHSQARHSVNQLMVLCQDNFAYVFFQRARAPNMLAFAQAMSAHTNTSFQHI